jgi:hypothetical protein
MFTRKSVAVFLVLGLGLLGCSKTQDTAPETRVFGAAPTIGGVTMDAGTRHIDCDITTAIKGFLCGSGLYADSYQFSPNGIVQIDIDYTEFTFHVQATDPDSTQAQNDILLVTASYKSPADQGQIEETSLLLLDDGGALKFPWKQNGGLVENCTFDVAPNPPCTCQAASYELTTNDPVPNDNTFTRGFGFLAPGGGIPDGLNAFAMVQTCLAKVANQAPTSSTFFIDKDLSFKIEVIDRAGTDTVWPVETTGHINPTTMTCDGDLCACCLATTSDVSACSGKPGLIALTPDAGWPVGTGLCETF